MKRAFAILIAFLVLAALAGCRQEVPPAENNIFEVSTADEFLAALGSNREIHLLPGSYVLSDAATYGKPSGSLSYRWADVYGGYSLELNGLENLTIVGAGQDSTSLLTDERAANVLQLMKCHNVSLSGFTAGHSQAGDATCAGAVVSLQSSEIISLTNVGLFGCGDRGLETSFCRDITLTDSRIFDCATTGVLLNDTSSVSIRDCSFEDLGHPYGGYAVISQFNTQDVRCVNNAVRGCNMTTFSSAFSAMKTRFENLRFEECSFDTLFQLDSEVTLVDPGFMDTRIMNWFSWDGASIVDGSGKYLNAQDLSALYSDIVKPMSSTAGGAEVIPVISAELHQVTVSTVDEFLAAIAPNTEIILDAPLLIFSQATDYGVGSSDYYYWEDCFDGPGLVISDLENFSIRSSDEDITQRQLQSDPRYANVLHFVNCKNISVSGFTAGHTTGDGYCTGGVLAFTNCTSVLVDNCGLFGCGTLGVDADSCTQIQVKNCDIYECSYGGMMMHWCDEVDVAGCGFRDLGGCSYTFWNCGNVYIDGIFVGGDYVGN